MTNTLSRRAFVATIGGSATGALVLEACGIAAGVGKPGASTGTTSPSAIKVKLPTYVPQPSAKPDLPGTVDGIDPGYTSYPKDNFKSVTDTPSNGGEFTFMTWNTGAPIPPVDQNPPWQEINKQIGGNIQFVLSSVADYMTKVQTTIASGELPDAMYLSGPGGTPPNIENLAEFLKAKCADLTPYLSGDAIKDYPNLANIPTTAWRVPVYDNAIYGIPNMIANRLNMGLYVHQEVMDQAGLSDPKSADDWKRILQALTNPSAGQWGIDAEPGSAFVTNGFYSAMFGAPNNWRIDANGKMTKAFETDEFKQAVAYNRDLWAAGVYSANSITNSNVQARTEFSGRKAIWRWDGFNGTGTFQFWDQALALNPPSRLRNPGPFPAQDGGKAQYFLGRGSGGITVLKQASSDRIKEVLRVLNFIAAPFGSQEHLLIHYGVKGVDYNLDDHGNPVLTDQGKTDMNFIWPYIVSPAVVLYYPKAAEFPQVMQDGENAMLAAGVEDPTIGLYSPTDVSQGPVVNQGFIDGVADIIVGRRPMSDFDQLVKDWASKGGDTIRAEYQDALQRSA